MNRALLEGGLGRYSVLGHEQVNADTTTSGGVKLPNLPNDNRVRRTVIRNLGVPIDMTLDGSDPAAGKAMRVLADEITVLDTDPDGVRLRAGSGTVDCRIIYFGT